LIASTVYLAAAEESADPWHVLGSTYAERLAIAALADLALARLVTALPEGRDESPAARRVQTVPGPIPAGALGVAVAALTASTKQLDVDRAVRLLDDLAPAIEADLVATGALVEGATKGLFKKRAVLSASPAHRDAARGRIRAAASSTAAADRALVLIATMGLSGKEMAQMCGGTISSMHDPFEPFSESAVAPDGHPLGTGPAELLTALVYVLAGTGDSDDGSGGVPAWAR
jgi:Golgi phosphoprotein 3 (GPP34)